MRWKDPTLTLGERCVAFAENEMANNVSEDSKNSYTSTRIKEYFSICTRLIGGKEVKLNLLAGNWCASGASFCLNQSLLPGEKPMHGYRVGVVEIIADLESRKLYRKKGTYLPKVGDLIFFDRSNPNDASTAWWRHIGRVQEVGLNSFKCISGNNGGRWRVSEHKFDQPSLLGFGEYPELDAEAVLPVADLSHIDFSEISKETFFDEFDLIDKV